MTEDARSGLGLKDETFRLCRVALGFAIGAVRSGGLVVGLVVVVSDHLTVAKYVDADGARSRTDR